MGTIRVRAVWRPLIALYLLAGLLVLATAAGWVVLDPIKYAVIDATAAGDGLLSAALQALAVYWVRVLVVATTGLAGAAILLRLEWRDRALSEALRGAPGAHFLVLAAAVLLWITHAYFYPGHLLGGDSGSHIARLAHFGRGLQDGDVLFWNNYFYMGAPFLQFYAPVFYWLGGISFAAIGDAAQAVKVLLFILHAASGILFYAFVRCVGIGRIAALVGAIGYAGAWAHGQLIFYQGVLPLAVIMALLPAAFLMAERLLQGGRHYGWCWVGLALASGAMLATHQPHGIFAGVYLAVYVLARLVMIGFPWRLALAIAGAGVAGVAMAMFAVVPFLAERHWVMAERSVGLIELVAPSIDYFGNLLIWSNTSVTQGQRDEAYIGISLALLALVSVASIPFAGSKRHGGFLIMMTLLLLWSIFWQGDSAVRGIVFTLFFVSFLGAAGVDWLLARVPQWPRLAMALVLIVLVDLGSTALQPLARTDKAYLDGAGRHLTEAAADHRLMLTNTRQSNDAGGGLQTDVGPSGDPIQYYPVQTVSGPHNNTATKSHNYAASILMRAHHDLVHGGRLEDDSRALLAMLNVGAIVNDHGRGMGFPDQFETNAEAAPIGRYFEIEMATPAVFAPALFALPPDPALEFDLVWGYDFGDEPTPLTERIRAFVEDARLQMEFRPEAAMAARLPVRALPAGPLPTADTAPADSEPLVVESYEVEVDRVTLAVTAPASGWLQLAHPWYPTQTVEWNGDVIEPVRGSFNLLVVPAQAGENVYTVTPRRSALRIGMGLFSAAVLLFVLVVPILGPLRRLRRPAAPAH